MVHWTLPVDWLPVNNFRIHLMECRRNGRTWSQELSTSQRGKTLNYRGARKQSINDNETKRKAPYCFVSWALCLHLLPADLLGAVCFVALYLWCMKFYALFSPTLPWSCTLDRENFCPPKQQRTLGAFMFYSWMASLNGAGCSMKNINNIARRENSTA